MCGSPRGAIIALGGARVLYACRARVVFVLSRLSRTRFIRSASAALFAVALLFGTGCGREEADQTASAPPVERPAVSDAPLPEPGTARVEFADGRVSVLSNGAQRLAVLRQLAEQAGFELVTGDVERRALSLRIEDASLGEALSALLRGVRYGVEYEFDAGAGSHALVRLTVGEPVEVAAAAQPRAGPPPEAERRDEEQRFESAREARARWYLERLRRRNAAGSREERERLREERAARAEAMEEKLLEQLGDPDPAVRAEAVSELPVTGEGDERTERLQRLTRVSADDPDPRVRIAAVERLGETDSPDAVASLVGALSDPDREVVLEALDALQDLDDASAIPHLDPLLQHPDPEIRDEAQFTKEWLQW